jgi:hypothetical protein
VAHDIGVEAVLLRREPVVDRLDRATEFAQAAEVAVGWCDALDMDAGAGRRDLVQIGRKPRHVGRARSLVDEALPEDAHSNILFHRRTVPSLEPPRSRRVTTRTSLSLRRRVVECRRPIDRNISTTK